MNRVMVGTVVTKVPMEIDSRTTIPDPPVSRYLLISRDFPTRLAAYTAAYQAGWELASSVPEGTSIDLYHPGLRFDPFLLGIVAGMKDAIEVKERGQRWIGYGVYLWNGHTWELDDARHGIGIPERFREQGPVQLTYEID